MRPTDPVHPTVVKISTPEDILGVLPHRLGFHPTESLVIVCLEGPRRRDRLVMRIDLPPSELDRRLAREMADRVRQAGVSNAVLVCYTEATVQGPGLARAGLVEALEARLAAFEIGVVEALLVQGGRWWSYSCHDRTCCPPAGRPLPSEPTAAASHYAAESVGHGGAVLEDRAALAASIEPVRNAVAAAVRVQAARAAEDSVLEAIARDGVQAPGRLALSVLRRLVVQWSEGHRDMTPEGAALVALGLRDSTARDEAMTLVLDCDGPVLVALLTELVRCVDGPDAAPVCTLLAVAAYAEGEGALATVAAERALRCRPGYRLALLVLESMSIMVGPAAVRLMAQQVRAGLAG